MLILLEGPCSRGTRIIPAGGAAPQARQEGRVQPQELAGQLFSRREFEIVDVRTGFEFKAGHIPGAIHAPTWKIVLGLAPLPADKETRLVVLCELGPRAKIARSILGLIGYRNVTLLEGHMAGWRRSGLPIEKG